MTTFRAQALAIGVLGLVGCVGSSPVPCTQCDGVCVDVQNDRRHCGGCGNACAAGSVCTAGACVLSCPTGQSACNGVCFDLKNDPGHCGSCGRVCAANEYCSQGACQSIVADAGMTGCPTGTTSCNGSCFDQQNDPRNCGACGRTCNSTEYCSAGNCLQFPVMGLDAGTCLASANPCEVVSATDAGCVVTVRACPAPGVCQMGGACNPATGACEYSARTGACDDQNPCTLNDVCTGGMCVGTNPVACVTPSACFETSVCQPSDGGCTSTPKAEGAACDDGDPCSGTDTCVAGRCAGSIRPALFDDFAFGTVPNAKWATTTRDGGVSQAGGQLTLRRAGQLVTTSDFRPSASGAVRITGEVTLGTSDWLRVTTRSTGVGPPFTGVEFLIKGGTANQLELRVGGTPSSSTAFTPSGTTVFEIFDDGNRVFLAARGKGRANHAIVTATIAATSTNGKIVFSNGDDTSTASSSTLDLVRIEQGVRAPTREWSFEEVSVGGGIIGGFGVLPDGGSSGDRSARFVTASPFLGSPSGMATTPVVTSGTFGAGVVASPVTGGHFPEFPANTLGASARSYSLSFWFLGSPATVVDLFGNRTDGSQGAQNYVSIRTRDDLGVAVEYSTLSMPMAYAAFQGLPATPLGDGNWHHLSVTRENRLSTLYIDGQFLSQVDAGTVNDLANANPYWFGRGFSNAATPIAYDDLRVFDDVALDACEVKRLASRPDQYQLCASPQAPCAQPGGAVACSDLQSDSANCGGCGNVCPVPPNTVAGACVAGGCGFTTCSVGFFDCNGLAADGCECTATLISVSIDGGAANGVSTNPMVDNSGQLVSFASTATNLVPNDTNGQPDCFLRDLRTSTTRRLSVDQNGNQLPQGIVTVGCSLSADGRFAAFTTTSPAILTDTNSTADVIVVDLATNTRSFGMLSTPGNVQPQPDTESLAAPFLSADGRYVMWSSRARGLFPGDAIQNESDIYIYDRATPQMRMASLSATGTVITSGADGYNSWSTSWTSNGRFVSYSTNAYIFGVPPPPYNICNYTYLVDMATTPPTPVQLLADGTTPFTCLSTAQRGTAAALYTNLTATFFVFTTRATLPNPSPSGALDQVYVRSGGLNGPSTLISLAANSNVAANGHSAPTYMSDDGSVISLISDASNLVGGDTNGTVRDCFVWRPGPTSRGRMHLLSQPATRTTAPQACQNITTSRNGRFAVLEMNDSMSPNDTNAVTDVYLRSVP